MYIEGKNCRNKSMRLHVCGGREGECTRAFGCTGSQRLMSDVSFCLCSPLSIETGSLLEPRACNSVRMGGQ